MQWDGQYRTDGGRTLSQAMAELFVLSHMLSVALEL